MGESSHIYFWGQMMNSPKWGWGGGSGEGVSPPNLGSVGCANFWNFTCKSVYFLVNLLNLILGANDGWSHEWGQGGGIWWGCTLPSLWVCWLCKFLKFYMQICTFWHHFVYLWGRKDTPAPSIFLLGSDRPQDQCLIWKIVLIVVASKCGKCVLSSSDVITMKSRVCLHL